MAKRPTRPVNDAGHDDGGDESLERLRRHLAFLGLTHPRHARRHSRQGAPRAPGQTSLLERVLGAEAARKLEQRVTRRIDGSGIREHKTLEAFDWSFQPTLDKAAFAELAHLDFVGRCDDLVITGKSGTGKSHLLMAIGRRACEHQLYVRYARCVDLLDDLHAGLADGT
ncbi:MAG: ATP-binding protein [Polyangiaceae bacterium]|nr:ATP-binding protein [Polyangiaceae bacterium]